MLKKLLSVLLFIVFVFSGYAQNPLGNGADGALIVNSSDTYFVDTVLTSLTGTNYLDSQSISVVDASSFTVGDEIIIITMQDAETDSALNRVGIYETSRIVSISSNLITLNTTLQNYYNASADIKHQVVKIPNFTNVTVDGIITCSAWDGTTGGILFFRASQSVLLNSSGIIEASGKGYRGGTQYGSSHGGGQGGESFVGIGGEGGNSHGSDGAGGGGAYYSGYNGGNGLAGGGGGGTSTAGIGSSNLGGAGGGGGGHAGSGGGAGYGTFGYGGFSYSNSICCTKWR